MALVNRVLIADDSKLVRRLVGTVIDAEPGFSVVGMADEGAMALELIERMRPELVVLDLEMPGMDGRQTLRRIEAQYPDVGVVVFTNVDPLTAPKLRREFERTSAILVPKPSNVSGIEQAIVMIGRALLPELRLQANRSAATRPRTGPSIAAVLIASSTGGPSALEAVIGKLPRLPVPTFIVQHISADFSGRLANQLDQVTSASVVEATSGVKPMAGEIYIAPGGAHLCLAREAGDVWMRTDSRPPVNSCRPSADVLFESAANVYGPNQLAVVLTGIGEDGLAGCRALSARGAPVLVQDEASSVVWGMPGAVANAGLATEVVALDMMAGRIDRLVTVRARSRV